MNNNNLFLDKLSLLCSLYLSTLPNWARGGSRGNQVVVMYIVITVKLADLTLNNFNFIDDINIFLNVTITVLLCYFLFKDFF